MLPIFHGLRAEHRLGVKTNSTIFEKFLFRDWCMAEPREVMNIREASQYLGISREALYKYVYEEKVPAFKLGNRWKFKKTVLDRWMERQSAQGERPRTRRRGAALG